MKNKGYDTKAVHGGEPHFAEGAHTCPIYQTSTFIFKNVEEGRQAFARENDKFVYTRLNNPTQRVLQNKLAILEGGEDCLVYGSGMGAIAALVMSLAKKGDHIVSGKVLYGCTDTLFSKKLTQYGLEITFVDASNPEEVEKAIKENTKLIYLETPANPTMDVSDIKEISNIAKKHNIPVAVDNTFATPFNQRPLELGADIIVHSLTKYLNGHGDVVGGAVIGKKEYVQGSLRAITIDLGATMSPEDAYRVIRGLKTFPLRMRKHNENGMKIAEFLENHPKIDKVYYPGLKSFPQHDTAKKQMVTVDGEPGFSGIIGFELKGGKEAGKKMMDYIAANAQSISLAVSLGTVDTLIQHPAGMTHANIPKEERLEKNITDGLVRISVGIENVEDIESDLKEALDQI
ncbi:MAG: PLP-dependent aspartate aminotransferase family protein [Nanoarchaeota archaeon]|nr:PLP-dependent aspartate aminotransferase family protein [Nanoarchaeota archaeon]MCG2718549.1 PLP-dependent aspartate aminotransferase family protein [Nanoarchaeota archaeon]